MLKKLIYVCSPVKGKNKEEVKENILKAKVYCKMLLFWGHIPLAPHVAFDGILDDNIQQERERALQIGLELVKRCDEVWVFGDRISEGMRAEIELAKKLGIPVTIPNNCMQTKEE